MHSGLTTPPVPPSLSLSSRFFRPPRFFRLSCSSCLLRFSSFSCFPCCFAPVTLSYRFISITYDARFQTKSTPFGIVVPPTASPPREYKKSPISYMAI